MKMQNTSKPRAAFVTSKNQSVTKAAAHFRLFVNPFYEKFEIILKFGLYPSHQIRLSA